MKINRAASRLRRNGLALNGFLARTYRKEAQEAKLDIQRRIVGLKEFLTISTFIDAVFIIGVCSICFQQCYNQVSEYLKYSTRIHVMHKNPTWSLYLLPAVTFCNNNRILMSQLVQRYPIIKDRISEALVNTSQEELMLLNSSQRIAIMGLIKSTFEGVIDLHNMTDTMPLGELNRISRYNMILDVNCHNLWGRDVNCENIRLIESYQDGPCVSLFYRGAIIEALHNGKAYDFNTSLLDGEPKLDSFNFHDIAEIIYDFKPFEYADFISYHGLGAKLMVHPNGHVGSSRDTSHLIEPGREYGIILKRYTSKRLQAPYKSDCFDYGANQCHFRKSNNSYASIEMDRTTCTRNCILRQTTKKCGCWPVEVPYYDGDQSIIEDSEDYRVCKWGLNKVSTNVSADYYISCYKNFYNECRKGCRSACDTVDYQMDVVVKDWPPPEDYLTARDQKTKTRLKRLEACCAKISLKYYDFLETSYNMYPLMTLAQLVGNIGGIVSASVGVSAITIYRFITQKVFHCKIVNER